MERKYIIVEDEFGNECAILFPPTLVHREVGAGTTWSLRGFMLRPPMGRVSPTAAVNP